MQEREAMLLAKRSWIAGQLQTDFDDLVRKWQPIHRRMIDDIRQIEGIDSTTTPSKDNATPGGESREPPTLAITRSRTAIAAARLSDMLFPHSDQPWDIAPANDPHIPEQDVPPNPATGEPAVMPEEVEGILKTRAEEMRKVIGDQLQETKFVAKARRMIEDATATGWGVLKGPIMGVRKRKTHRGELTASGNGLTLVSVTEIIEEDRPEVDYVDPWSFIADLAPTVDEAEKAFQIRLMTERDLRELTQLPGFDAEAIKRLLKTKPVDVSGSPILSSYAQKNSALGLTENLRECYVVLEYHGPMRKKWAEEQDGVYCCECLSGGKDEQGQDVPYTWEDDGSPLPMVTMFFCQGEVLKFKESPIESDTRLPFYVFTFHRLDDTFAGGGIPYLLRSMDRAIQAAWRMGLHNAAVSSGPIVFARKGKLSSADGRLSIKGPKILFVDGEEQALKDQVHTVLVPNNAEQYLQLLDRAMGLADEIINLPLMAQGPGTAVTQTASGLAMQLNANNIFQKRMAMGAEDSVIVPLIERMVEWNLTYGDPERLGGDFKVIPRTNALLVKDMQAQRLQAATMMAADPRFAMYCDNYELLKKNFEMLEISTDGIVMPEDKAREAEKAAQQQQPDPMVAIKQQEAEIKAQKIQSDNEVAHAKIEMADRDMQAKQAIAEMQIEQAYATLALQEDISLAEVQTGIMKAREASQIKREDMGVKARVAAETLAHKERAMQTEIVAERNRVPGPVIASQ